MYLGGLPKCTLVIESLSFNNFSGLHNPCQASLLQEFWEKNLSFLGDIRTINWNYIKIILNDPHL